MRIKLTVSYDGTCYCGWQVQPNGISVQQTLEKAIELATGESVKVVGSGRTDAGVHAAGQVAHFDTKTSIPPQKIYKAINLHLPPEIRVLDSVEVGEFDARKSAKKKTYCYTLYSGKVEQPLKERYAVYLDTLPDIEKMKSAAKLFIGEHDFKCFNASGGGAKTTVRTIYNIDIEEKGEEIKVYVCGNGFLYNMVRTLVGTLLKAGYEKIDLKQIKTLLDTGDKKLCGKTLPAKGLCLMSVEYEE